MRKRLMLGWRDCQDDRDITTDKWDIILYASSFVLFLYVLRILQDWYWTHKIIY